MIYIYHHIPNIGITGPISLETPMPADLELSQQMMDELELETRRDLNLRSVEEHSIAVLDIHLKAAVEPTSVEVREALKVTSPRPPPLLPPPLPPPSLAVNIAQPSASKTTNATTTND